jgi:hypothetical protein
LIFYDLILKFTEKKIEIYCEKNYRSSIMPKLEPKKILCLKGEINTLQHFIYIYFIGYYFKIMSFIKYLN